MEGHFAARDQPNMKPIQKAQSILGRTARAGGVKKAMQQIYLLTNHKDSSHHHILGSSKLIGTPYISPKHV
jgi:hypothetical protein